MTDLRISELDAVTDVQDSDEFELARAGASKKITGANLIAAFLEAGSETPELDAYVAEVMADTPKGFWKLDERRGLPQDSSGNALHMTANPGVNNRRYRMNGPMPGSFAILQHGGAYFRRNVISTVTDNWTMEMWFAFETAGGTDRIFYNGANDSSASAGWGLDYQAGPKFRALYGNVNWQQDSTGLITLGWHHLAIVRRAGTLEYYLDGAVDDSNAGTEAPLTPVNGTYIGSPAQVQGLFALCAIYETALSAARIADHFEASGV